MARLREQYQKEVVPALIRQFGYKNPMAVPRITKVVLNVGVGEAITNPRLLDQVSDDLAAITGQRPIIRRARKSIAGFKLREGMPIGVMVTLRRDRMFEFLDRLMNIALPRVRDFRGVSPNAFDGRGNYTLGIREHLIFPEIDAGRVDRIYGMNITIVTTAKTDEEARFLLEQLGMPFQRRESGARAAAVVE
ncbi:MAG: 50S ribosomal protein L5 [Acidobacteriota bacterium]